MTDQLKQLLEAVEAQGAEKGSLSTLLRDRLGVLYHPPVVSGVETSGGEVETIGQSAADRGTGWPSPAQLEGMADGADPFAPAGWEEKTPSPGHRSLGGEALAALYRQVADSLDRGIPAAARVGERAWSPLPHGAERAMGERWELPDPVGLTVEGLDWAVRRDSRRYDGGMNID